MKLGSFICTVLAVALLFPRLASARHDDVETLLGFTPGSKQIVVHFSSGTAGITLFDLAKQTQRRLCVGDACGYDPRVAARRAQVRRLRPSLKGVRQGAQQGTARASVRRQGRHLEFFVSVGRRRIRLGKRSYYVDTANAPWKLEKVYWGPGDVAVVFQISSKHGIIEHSVKHYGFILPKAARAALRRARTGR